MPLGAGNLWDAAVGEPYVELLDETGAVVNAFNMDVPHANHPANTIACILSHRHLPERSTMVLQNSKERDDTHGFRYYAHLYYEPTNKDGRALCALIINHLGYHKQYTVKFYPRRDNTDQWHICKLDGDPDVDGWVEHRAIGYKLELSLKGVEREPVFPDAPPVYMTNFNDVGLAYVGGDSVRNFGSVAAAYLASDYPGYFSEDVTKLGEFPGY
jgi:hypothetical protein